MTALADAPAASTAETLFASLTAAHAGTHLVRRPCPWPPATAAPGGSGEPVPPVAGRSRLPGDALAKAATGVPTKRPTQRPTDGPAPELRPAAGAAPMLSGTPSGTPAAPVRDARLPRARLLPAVPVGRTPRAPGVPLVVPPTVGERVRVLRAQDRSLVVAVEDDERRGAPPAADPGLVVRRLATASVEVITGIRPAAQLARWVAPGVLDALRVRSALSRDAGLRGCHAPSCRAVRVVRVEAHAVEATAVVDDGRRVRAVAVRLETHRGAWRATALEVG